jgi:alanine or glycine:cation symporter, AGCS family
MWTRLTTAFAILIATTSNAFAQASESVSLDERINHAITPVADFLSSIIFYSVNFLGTPDTADDFPVVVAWLIGGAVVFSIYMRFINIRGFAQAIRIVRGDYSDPRDDGEVSHFQALSAALSGTVGLGNIAGVAIAVGIGGPGATVWMIIAGFLGMTTKMVECTLGVKYRDVHADGTVSGGPMYYLSKGLAGRGWPGFGKALAIFASISCIGSSLGGGNMFQANQSITQLVNMFGGPEGALGTHRWVLGLIMAILVGLVILGGIKSIARVTGKLVPLMCGLYVLAAAVIIVVHFAYLPHAISVIISGAFDPDAIAGGIVGVLIQGFRRATFSNEAGVGSAPIAHSAVKTKEPVTEGLVALLEPFIDTVVICTMTAMVIVVTDTYTLTGVDGIAMTSTAFESVIPHSSSVLLIAVLLFAFSTMITWSYYGLKAWTYLLGKSPASELTYKVLFCVFVVIGATLNLGKVVDFSDAMFFAMAFPNILGLYILAPEVKRELNSYLARVRSGEIRKFVERRAE